ncbi:hypothetical protein L3X38_031485 [Prunus dulcis]|uniref:Uncharacterized protein n=1 Tax=Prunus dulcis TaxID=3755 RepID=A0AAD4VCL1_PRUDU|nr:hypothetical protein L3X38_031485 [Prunus dulcis]
MEEVEATNLLSHEKRKKVEDSQSSIFAAQGQNQMGRQSVKEFNRPNRSKSRDGRKDKHSATSVTFSESTSDYRLGEVTHKHWPL